MELSNKSLALILVVAMVVSLGGTVISLQKLDKLANGPYTGYALSQKTGTTNFTLQSSVVITFTNSLVDFGTGFINSSTISNYCDISTNATIGWNSSAGNNSCLGGLKNASPFLIQNDGNLNVNLTLQSSVDPWNFISGGGSGSGAYNPGFNWSVQCYTSGCCPAGLLYPGTPQVVNSTQNQTACTNFNWVDGADKLRLDIHVLIPTNANQTAHTATITATGTA